MIRFVLAAALACAACPAWAQQAPAAPAVDPAQAGDRVVVRGRRLGEMTVEEYTRNFVGEVANPVGGNFGVARWGYASRLCVGVENIPADAAQYVIDRIAERALEVGLRIGAPGCTPNISIVFAADGASLATFVAEESPGALRPWGGTGGTTQGLAALERFKTSDDPVRWWQISMPVDRAGNVAIALPGSLSGPPVVAGSNSRITNLISDELWGVLVIVDVRLTQQATVAQLADYLALVTLTQVDPDAETAGYDSILNLFSSASPPARMTEWDRAYLTAMYEFDQLRTPRMQPSLIASEMMRAQIAFEGE